MISVALPIPPTVNHMYRHHNNQKRLSAEYRRWRKEAGAILLPYKMHHKRMHQPPFQYTARFYWPDARKRDGDNRLKPLQDTVSATLGFDDSLIKRGTYEIMGIDRANPRCELEFGELWTTTEM